MNDNDSLQISIPTQNLKLTVFFAQITQNSTTLGQLLAIIFKQRQFPVEIFCEMEIICNYFKLINTKKDFASSRAIPPL